MMMARWKYYSTNDAAVLNLRLLASYSGLAPRPCEAWEQGYSYSYLYNFTEEMLYQLLTLFSKVKMHVMTHSGE